MAHFEFRGPAEDVRVAGSFNDWKATPLQKRDNAWQLDLPLKPGRYEYRLVVNGQWQEDPACPECAPNPYGTRNSVLTVR